MKLTKKLFRVTIGAIINEEGDDSPNWRSETVVATTATEAMKRVKLKNNKSLNEYYSGVTMVSEIDKA